MNLPKRFALRTLLLLMLVVAMVFGYAQWRRQWLNSEVEALGNDPSHSSLKLRFHDDWFWPTISQEAYIDIEKRGDGSFVVDGRTLTLPEAKQFLMEKADRLHALGVRHFGYRLFTPDKFTTGIRFTKNRFVMRKTEITSVDDFELE